MIRAYRFLITVVLLECLAYLLDAQDLKCPSRQHIVIALDASTSMEKYFSEEKTHAVQLINFLRFQPDVVFTLWAFSDTVTEIAALGHSLTYDQIISAVYEYPFAGGETKTELVLEKVKKILETKSSDSFFAFVILTDGYSDNSTLTNLLGSELRENPGIKVFSVSAAPNSNLAEMEQLASDKVHASISIDDVKLLESLLITDCLKIVTTTKEMVTTTKETCIERGGIHTSTHPCAGQAGCEIPFDTYGPDCNVQIFPVDANCSSTESSIDPNYVKCSNAIDGAPYGKSMADGHCWSSSSSERRPSIQIDLGNTYNVQVVKVYPREDDKAYQTGDFDIRIGDPTQNSRCDHFLGKFLKMGEQFTAICSGWSTGRYLIVVNTRAYPSSICEIRIFGLPAVQY